VRIQFNAGDVLPEVNLRVETGEQKWIRPFAEQRSNLTDRGDLTPQRPLYVVKLLRPLFVLPRQQNWGQVFQLIAHARTVMACSQRVCIHRLYFPRLFLADGSSHTATVTNDVLNAICLGCLWLSADQNWVDPGRSQSIAQ
jgi:hypothetical protein